MKIFLSLLFLLVFSTNAGAGEACSPGKTATLVQPGMPFDMVWIGFNNAGQDKGTYKPFQTPVTSTVVCHWSQQVIHVQEAGTHGWIKLGVKNGIANIIEEDLN